MEAGRPLDAGRPTVKTVAERAGVSTASVSRVLNGFSARPETRRRVEQAVAELAYSPDAAARSLKLGSSGQVACALADIGNPVYVEMITAIEEVVSRAGLRLVIHSTHSDAEAEEKIVRGLGRGYADGLIISPLRPTDRLVALLAASQQPVVAVGNISPRADVDTVRVDSRAAVGIAMTHLYASGARRIVMVNGPQDTSPGRIRGRAFADELRRRHHLAESTITARIQHAPDFTRAGGLIAINELISHQHRDRGRIDAVLCANDTLATGVLRGLHAAGISVPGDVLVASIDDTELCELTTPRLTSVSLRAAERGAIAADLLLDRLGDPELPARARRRSVRPELVVRESSHREAKEPIE